MKSERILKLQVTVSTLALVLASLAVAGCGETEAGDGDVNGETSAVTLANGPAFVGPRCLSVTDSNGVNVDGCMWAMCAPNQVVVGWHGSGRALCATVTGDTTILSTHIDVRGPTSTQIFPGGVQMHGCPSGSYMQGIYPLSSEFLYCVTFKNVHYSTEVTLDTGTQSNTVYGISSPQSHVCPASRTIVNGVWTGGYDAQSMVGIHRGKNFLACVK